MNDSVIDSAKRVFQIEIDSLTSIMERLGDEIEVAANLVINCSGRVILTGMGKSGSIGKKLSGTFASTGTPSLFLHPAEGVHGDLGMVTKEDVVVALSYSGETDEIIAILPVIKRIGAQIIAITGNPDSTLSRYSEITLNITVEKEACPLGLAPTASTTAMLAMGDALAISVMEMRKFTRSAFAVFHPAGSLGRQLLLQVSDIMRTEDQVAVVSEDTKVKDVLFSITNAHAGAAVIIDSDGKMIGIITDGDIRRGLLNNNGFLDRKARDVMIPSPKFIAPERLAAEGLRIMEQYKIGEMPVLDGEGRPLGMLMLKDLLRAGLV